MMLPRLVSSSPAILAGATTHASPMSTFVRAGVLRMLSNNPSHIVDISHDKELRRGLTTSGERMTTMNIPDSVADPARAAAAQEADALGPEDTEMASRIHTAIGKSQGTFVGESNRRPAVGTAPVKEQVQMADDYMKEQRTPMDDSIDRMKQQDITGSSSSSSKDMNKVPGNNQWQSGQQPDNMVEEPAMKGEIGKGKGQQVSAKTQEAWDRTDPFEKTLGMKETMKDEPIDEQHIQPGTRHLQGTKDNFNDDPAISLGQIQDAARSVKETVANSTVGQMLHDAKQTVKDSEMRKEAKEAIKATTVGHALKDMKDAVKSTVKEATVKAKEFVTGEKEKEKPDETKSEVRTVRGSSRRGNESFGKQQQQQDEAERKRKQQQGQQH